MLHGTTKTGTTRAAASSGPDQAQEQARSGGPTLHATENRTLTLAEKASSCGQERASWVNNRGRPGRRSLPEEKAGTETEESGSQKQVESTEESGSQKQVESTGSQGERCHGHRNDTRKAPDGAYVERGSFVWGALARRGERRGASDPAGGNGSHHAPLRPPTASPGRELNTKRR